MVGVPGTNMKINTRSFNPFADAVALATPQGLAQGINPFVEIAVRNALGAPENGFAKQYRINEFGQSVPDTDPTEGIGKILTGLPQSGLAGALTGSGPQGDQGIGRGIGKFFGASTYSPEQLANIKSRLGKSQQVVDTGSPFAKIPSSGASSRWQSRYAKR
jgi:hypothetical protein